jgi:tRNA A37 threonylcarbamoyladenosine dehydratase
MNDTAVADADRRFAALARLYGDEGYALLRGATFAVVGLGGVGSWAAEALARCGVAALVLIDLDHVAESNINRQVQADTHTLGMSKPHALGRRVEAIHPGCRVHEVEAFVEPGNWPALLPAPVDALIDACDQVRAKVALAAWALEQRVPMVSAGAAGGKRLARQVQVADLAEATHDPLLARLRSLLRKDHRVPREGPIGVRCVFSREPLRRPPRGCEPEPGAPLACHGYGSSVTVTATFGMAAAGEAIEQLLRRPRCKERR